MVQGCSTIGTSYNQFVMMRQHTWYCSMWFMRRKGISLGLLPRVRKIVAAGAGYIVVIGSVGCRGVTVKRCSYVLVLLPCEVE
jgi:hypothetical protein